MTAYLPKIFSTYNNHGATPITHEARKVLLHKAFRASFTLAASLYIGPADAAAGGDLPLWFRQDLCAKLFAGSG